MLPPFEFPTEKTIMDMQFKLTSVQQGKTDGNLHDRQYPAVFCGHRPSKKNVQKGRCQDYVGICCKEPHKLEIPSGRCMQEQKSSGQTHQDYV
jgi:hypothetical protein